MKVVDTESLRGTDREVVCPRGGFVSLRAFLESDRLGFSVLKTEIPKGPAQPWHYRHHVEVCFCVQGAGVLVNTDTDEYFTIEPGMAYQVGKGDPHTFQALEDTVLISVFRPALIGNEVHDEDNSYGSFISPVYGVIPVPIEKVQANDYNPNKVAPPEMELLETSIWEDGYTQPVVTYYDEDSDMYVVVDGFHRYLILKTSDRIRERERGMLPVVVIDKEMGDRMASTIRHNRARGTHNIELMSTIVAELVEMGKGDRWICTHIGMSPDELLRMKQITGLASLFQNRDFSDSWEAEIENDAVDLDDDWIDLDESED